MGYVIHCSSRPAARIKSSKILHCLQLTPVNKPLSGNPEEWRKEVSDNRPVFGIAAAH